MRKPWFFWALIVVAGCSKKTTPNAQLVADAAPLASVTASAEPPPLDAAAFLELAQHPKKHKASASHKEPGVEPQSAFTFDAPGLPGESVDVQVFDRHPGAWSLLLVETKAQPSQFGRLAKLFERPIVKGTNTWYRIEDGPLAGCYLAWLDGVAKSITIDSFDFVVDDDEPDEKALGEWLASHPRDGGS